MTEQEWSAATEPRRMLALLDGCVSERKLYLFAAACCRRVEHLFRDERSQRALEMAERHADGLAVEAELRAAREEAQAAVEQWRQGDTRRTQADVAVLWARQAAAWAIRRPVHAPRWAGRAAALAEVAAERGAAQAQLVGAWGRGLALVPEELVPATWQALALPTWWAVRMDEAESRKLLDIRHAAQRQEQCRLLREIVGNPFRSVEVEPAWLSYGGGVVGRVAQSVYEEQQLSQLPVLADALEEAGCTEADLLAHLRGPGPHARGCWALDSLLGKSGLLARRGRAVSPRSELPSGD
jgi:hypothetical protein